MLFNNTWIERTKTKQSPRILFDCYYIMGESVVQLESYMDHREYA